jgi:hypothetical protein
MPLMQPAVGLAQGETRWRECVFNFDALRHADGGYAPASSPTWSAIASDDVSPGDSMPNRLIRPLTP